MRKTMPATVRRRALGIASVCAISLLLGSDRGPERSSTADDETGGEVDQHRYHGKHEAELGQGSHRKAGAVSLCAVELGQDRGGNGGHRPEDIGSKMNDGTTDHGDGHRLAERPSQAKYRGADDACPYPGQSDFVRH